MDRGETEEKRDHPDFATRFTESELYEATQQEVTPCFKSVNKARQAFPVTKFIFIKFISKLKNINE